MGMDTARRIIVALDFDTVNDAEAIVDRLGDAGQSYKIGLGLLTVGGPTLATRLAAEGKDVFLCPEGPPRPLRAGTRRPALRVAAAFAELAQAI
jgi:orotidine-5'-phosphate decarboxylase